MRIGSIESFTGGAFAARIISKPNASNFFIGSIVTYSNEIKEKLGVNVKNGVINSNTAKEMALKGKKFLEVDYCFSFTGNAGPTSLEGKPVGNVFIGINDKVFELNLKGTRKEIIDQAVNFAISKLKNI